MKNIGIITNREKDIGLTYTNQLIEALKSMGDRLYSQLLPQKKVWME